MIPNDTRGGMYESGRREGGEGGTSGVRRQGQTFSIIQLPTFDNNFFLRSCRTLTSIFVLLQRVYSLLYGFLRPECESRLVYSSLHPATTIYLFPPWFMEIEAQRDSELDSLTLCVHVRVCACVCMCVCQYVSVKAQLQDTSGVFLTCCFRSAIAK